MNKWLDLIFNHHLCLNYSWIFLLCYIKCSVLVMTCVVLLSFGHWLLSASWLSFRFATVADYIDCISDIVLFVDMSSQKRKKSGQKIDRQKVAFCWKKVQRSVRAYTTFSLVIQVVRHYLVHDLGAGADNDVGETTGLLNFHGRTSHHQIHPYLHVRNRHACMMKLPRQLSSVSHLPIAWSRLWHHKHQ